MLDRAPLKAEERGQLDRLVASGGLYRLRLPSSTAAGAPHVVTSFPARCLAAAGADGGLELDVIEGGHVAGLALSAPCTPAASGGAAAELELPASQTLALRLPTAAPEVTPQLVPGQVAADAAAAMAGSLQQEPAAAAGEQQQAGQQAAQGGAGEKGGADARKPPQPDDRTWLQKNWMLVLPLGFIVSGAQRMGRGPAASRSPPTLLPLACCAP